MSSEQDKNVNLFDSKVSKRETALTLAFYGIGGLFTLSFLDLGTVALGLKEATALPADIQTFATLTGTALLGYILGKKSNDGE